MKPLPPAPADVRERLAALVAADGLAPVARRLRLTRRLLRRAVQGQGLRPLSLEAIVQRLGEARP